MHFVRLAFMMPTCPMSQLMPLLRTIVMDGVELVMARGQLFIGVLKKVVYLS